MLLYGHGAKTDEATVSESQSELPRPEFQPNFDPVHRFSAWLERMGKAEATIEAYHTDVADLVRAYAPRPVEIMDIPGKALVRVGFSMYNTKDEAERLVQCVAALARTK